MRDSIWSVPSLYEIQDMPIKSTFEPIVTRRTSNLIDESFKRIPGNTWCAKLASCNSCHCCPRHMTLRPTTLHKWIETPDGPKHYDLGNCNCECRHLARFICRQVDTDGSMAACPSGPSWQSLTEEPA